MICITVRTRWERTSCSRHRDEGEQACYPINLPLARTVSASVVLTELALKLHHSFATIIAIMEMDLKTRKPTFLFLTYHYAS